MSTSIRLTICIGLFGCAAVLIIAYRTDAPPLSTPEGNVQAAVIPPILQETLAAGRRLKTPQVDGESLRPSQRPHSAPSAAPAPAESAAPLTKFVARPQEEAMLSSWAARDPEGAGRWLSQNPNHPKFADLVRGYAIQIATIDPSAARQWAALLNGNGNRFAHGGTLEQHIDAVEAMLKAPAAPQAGEPEFSSVPLIPADYQPVLVRQSPGEPPVLEMEPTRPDI